MKLTLRYLSLQCWTNSCSLPANKLRPTGNSLFRHATIKLAAISLSLSLFLSRFFFFFYIENCWLRATFSSLLNDWTTEVGPTLPPPPPPLPPVPGSGAIAVRRVAVGIINTILSISFTEMKFCSSRKKYCKQEAMAKEEKSILVGNLLSCYALTEREFSDFNGEKKSTFSEQSWEIIPEHLC